MTDFKLVSSIKPCGDQPHAVQKWFERFRPGKKTVLGAGLVVLAVVIAAVWIYVDDLRTQFPELDFFRSRIGIASWYSRTDRGIHERTANNEVFDDKAMTCASWYYPFGEKLVVINSLNGQWVVCRVNDRGPDLDLRRAIDLTRGAFKKISNLKRGLIYVTVIPTTKKNAGGAITEKHKIDHE